MSRSAEVLRVLERYLVEVVERYELCPWACMAREHREIAVGVLWGTPSLDGWVAEAKRLLAQPQVRVAMVVAPEAAVSCDALRTLRDGAGERIPAAGVAEFHPTAALDLATPTRLVRFLRRSPDPMLQLVPLALIDAVRGSPVTRGLGEQASMLGGHAKPPRQDVSARIAAANHATVAYAHAEMTAALEAIAADRDAAYARVGIHTPSGR